MRETKAAVTYSRAPTGPNVTSPVTFKVSFDNFGEIGCPADYSYWGVITGYSEQTETVGNVFYPSSRTSGNFTFPLPMGGYSGVNFLCSIDDFVPADIGSAVGNDIEGDGSYLIFRIVAESSGGTVNVHTPEIKILSSVPKESFSGPLEIKYKASDEDNAIGRPDYGLKELPVNIYYNSIEEASNKFVPIAENQPASGTIIWDTSKIRDGGYRLRLTASGVDGDFGQAITDFFVLDNSKPIFKIDISPDFSKGEPVNLEIESSESLKDVTVLKIAQAGQGPVEVELKGRPDLRKFTANYRPVQGFDGLAQIFISGEDLSGNGGNSIVGDDSFWVGIKPPRAPIIKSPENKITITENKIDIEGIATNAKRVILKVNGEREYIEEKIGRRGQFLVRGIQLDPAFNKGRNFITIRSEDFKGIISEPATLEILINSPPTISLTEPKGRLLKLNGLIRFAWKASDINDDLLTYGVELSDDGGNNWKIIAQNLKTKEFVWDSSWAPDGSNYLIRAIVSDGTFTGEAKGNRFGIVNNLPIIILDASGDFFTAEETKIFAGFVRSREDLIRKLELSFDNGKSWKEILPEDGLWDSNLEKFSLAVLSLRAGPKQILLRGTSRSGKIVINAQQLKIFFDNQIPTFISEDLSTKPSKNPYLKINGIARDNFAGIKSVEYAIDDSGWFLGVIERGLETERAEFKINHPDTLKDGEHSIKIRVVDRAGNISKVKIQKINIDATAPRLGSFIIRLNGKIVLPKNPREFELPLNSAIGLFLAIAGKPKETHLFLSDKEIDFKLNEKKLWQADFIVQGDAAIRVLTNDELGNKKEKEIAKIFVR